MSAPAFTPGPWEYTGTVAMHDRPDLPCVVDEHRLVVAQCWDDGHTEDECQANARLIAAAPELYEALEALLKGCSVISDKMGIDVEAECLAFANSPFAVARRALAKARGDSQ